MPDEGSRQPKAHKPRLLLVCTNQGVGGMERVVLPLSRQFVMRGWTVRTVFPDFLDEAERERWLAWALPQAEGIEFSRALPAPGEPRGLAQMRALRQLVRESEPDVVNLHYGAGHISGKDVLASRLASRHRLVVSVHHPTPWSEVPRRARWMTLLSGLAGVHAVKKARWNQASRSTSYSRRRWSRGAMWSSASSPTPRRARRARRTSSRGCSPSSRSRRSRPRGIGIETVLTPIRAPKVNAIAERVIGTFRRECLDHLILVNERHLRSVLNEYVAHYNHARPHQSLELWAPDDRRPRSPPGGGGRIVGRRWASSTSTVDQSQYRPDASAVSRSAWASATR